MDSLLSAQVSFSSRVEFIATLLGRVSPADLAQKVDGYIGWKLIEGSIEQAEELGTN